MKRFTVLLLLIGLLTPSVASLVTYASASGQEPDSITDSGGNDPAPSEEQDDPSDELSTDPLPPETEPLPPETDPPPPETEESPTDYPALLFDSLVAVIDAGGELYTVSTAEPLEIELLEAVCSRLLEKVARFFYLRAIDVSIITLPAPDEEGNLYRYDLRPIYVFAPGEELDAAKAFVEEETAAIIAQIPADATEFEQVLFLHDYLCTAFAYDGTHTVGDLYHLLKSGHGVCQAYVYLYAYLLDLVGIANDYAVSDGMNHIWNLVELDGNWYHVDLTWDDPTEDQPGRALHTNFLRSDEGIAETGHKNWIAPYPCESDLYENSILPDLTGAILFAGSDRYAVSRSKRALMKIDLTALTAEEAADLSLLRWAVWEKPGNLYKDQYINLYYDGFLIYFNGPDTVRSYDPATGAVETVIDHHPSAGYLYSLSGDGHTLTCTLSKAPGALSGTVTFETPHRYNPPTDGLFSTHTCLLCGHEEHILSPDPSEFFTAFLSTRPGGGLIHDLRLLLLINEEMLNASPELQITLTLHSSDGDRSVTTMLSPKDDGDLLVYERIAAGGKEYAAADGSILLGLILRNLDCNSYDAVTLTVIGDDKTVYQSTVSADLLPHATVPEPPDTQDAPTADDPILTEDAPDAAPQA
ncbi:MAG: transglutaminase domain-containing protein [Eubacteriales bacterium]